MYIYSFISLDGLSKEYHLLSHKTFVQPRTLKTVAVPLTKMRLMHVITLAIIIVAGICFNVSAVIFISRKNSNTSLRDKIVVVLCVINLLQTIGFGIEVHSTVTGLLGEVECQASAFIVSFITYTASGCFVALTLER